MSKTVNMEAGLYYYIEALEAMKGDQFNALQIGVQQPSGKTHFPINKSVLKQFVPSR